MKRLQLYVLSCAGLLLAGVLIFAGCNKPASAVSTPPVVISMNMGEPTEAQPKLSTVRLWIGPEQMDAEKCATGREVQTGMMFRKTMGDNDGMIFNLVRPQQAAFWMKNCYVPLSVAYINPDGVIEEIHPLQPQDTNSVFSVTNDILFALETPQGWFEKHHIQPGTVILDVGGKAVTSPGDVRKALINAKDQGKHDVLMRLKTGEATKFVAVIIGQKAAG